MRLRLFVPQNILQSARNECASIGIIQISWILYEIDALLESVVLMANITAMLREQNYSMEMLLGIASVQYWKYFFKSLLLYII